MPDNINTGSPSRASFVLLPCSQMRAAQFGQLSPDTLIAPPGPRLDVLAQTQQTRSAMQQVRGLSGQSTITAI